MRVINSYNGSIHNTTLDQNIQGSWFSWFKCSTFSGPMSMRILALEQATSLVVKYQDFIDFFNKTWTIGHLAAAPTLPHRPITLAHSGFFWTSVLPFIPALDRPHGNTFREIWRKGSSTPQHPWLAPQSRSLRKRTGSYNYAWTVWPTMRLQSGTSTYFL